MDKVKAIELLKKSLSELGHMRTLYHYSEEAELWKDKVNCIAKETWGEDSDEYQGINPHIPITILGLSDAELQRDFLEELTTYERGIKKIIQKYEIIGIPLDSLKPLSDKPKAFIAHGGKSGVLDKLREFVQALGVDPLIVELLPSKTMSVDDKVNRYIKDADCGIVLATKGNIIDKGSRKQAQHPRLNVIDELERLRAAFPNRTILLLERDVDLPSNISRLTYEPFVRQSMDRAFTAIARELVAFGILKAVKPKTIKE